MKWRARWLTVVTFATAMAWLEAATVYYIRTLVDRIEPYQQNPLPFHGGLGQVELVREAATLVMIFTTGVLAGRSWKQRIGFAAVAFGTWDILYYAFLQLISGWPRSLFDWDILFLLPVPWWGPVLAPMSIALLMIAWGTFAVQEPDPLPSATAPRTPLAVGLAGVALALALFTIDAWRALPGGVDAVTRVLPTTFNWPAFCVALALMAIPVAHMGWRAIGGGWRDAR